MLALGRSARALATASRSRRAATAFGRSFSAAPVATPAVGAANLLLPGSHQQHHHRLHQHQRQQTRNFGKKIVDVRRSNQREIWAAYLNGSIDESALFFEIDLNRSRTITVEEIEYFLDSVNREGVAPGKFELLQQLGQDHVLDKDEFHRWLVMATDVANDGSGFAMKEEDSSSSSSSDSEDEATDAASNEAKPKRKVVDVRHSLQSMVWDVFLSKGTCAPDLFKMIDLNRSGKISVSEISYFVESIGNRGVSHGALMKLRELGDDHELDEGEFYEWLGDATGVPLGEDGEKLPEDVGSSRANAEGCTPGNW